MHHVEQLDDVGVVQLLQNRNLADGGAGNALLLAFQSDLFEGVHLVGLFVWDRGWLVPRTL